uniref:Uncharacterized protein n=1 Tax=Anguilla anguilla TaxID=7936 RepID=A0A0E9W942_ANGAN
MPNYFDIVCRVCISRHFIDTLFIDTGLSSLLHFYLR